MVAVCGGRISVAVHVPLVPLMSGMPGIAQVMPSLDPYCPMLSLPFVLGTRLDSIPANVPYLPSPTVKRIQAQDSRLLTRPIGVHCGNRGEPCSRSYPSVI